jgi:hypothetical protein
MNKKVEFNPIKGYELIAIKPEPAKINIPEWYKKMPMTMKDMTNLAGNDLDFKAHTSKRCVPLMDGMTAGYYLYSYADVKVSTDKGCTRVDWMSIDKVIETHPRGQFPGVPLPVGFYKDEAFKWFNPVSIKTPKGYSTLFVTPMLRHELPFWCFPAIVDTDTYNAAIHFPFLFRKNWEGMIPRGTPIIQAIPFKRDDWKMSWNKESVENDKIIDFLKTYIHSAYKKNYWAKKYFV